MSFAGLNCLVTGASSGIGRAVAIELARSGARLWVVGRSRARLEQALCAAADSAQSITAHQSDFESREEVGALAVRLLEELDGLDIFVHCAGMISLGTVEAASAVDFDRLYSVNLRAPYVLTQALLPRLRKSHGQVAFLNSTAGLRANPNASQYSATKHGLKALADSLRDEVNKDGIRVLTVFSGRT